MDLSSSSLRSRDVGGTDPAIMLFGKRIQGRSTIDAADIKEELSPRGVDEGGAVSCGTTSSDEGGDLSSSQNVGTNKDEIKPGGEAKAKGTTAETGELKVETEEKQVRCPRCSSADTKFCYFNNYNVNQPRHFCKRCQRYWTAGGTLRNVPVGAGKRKSKHSARQAFPPLAVHGQSAPPTNLTSFLAHSVNTNLDLFAGPRPNPQCVFSTEIKGPPPNLQLQPPELGGVTSPIPQIGFSRLHEIKADSQSRFVRLGEINPNLQSEFSRLGEINANLQSGSCGTGKKNVNLQSGFSGLGEISSNLKTGFPGLGGIKANLQSGFYSYGLGANHRFSRLGQSKANLQSGLDQNKANLHIGCPDESNTIKPNSHTGGNGSREMKDYMQWSSESEPSGRSGLSDSKARLTGECNGLSQIKAPHLYFHSNEPHLSLSNSTEGGGVNTNSLEGCYEARDESWCNGQVLPVLGALWPCFYNMYWAAGGKPQQEIMPHFAPVLTPQGWGLPCVGAMATPISSSFATAPMATTAAPPSTSSGTPHELPPPATTTLGKRAAQHESIRELRGLFCSSKSSKVRELEPSTSRSPNSTTLGSITAIAQAPTRVAFT